jgi:signal peptidase I
VVRHPALTRRQALLAGGACLLALVVLVRVFAAEAFLVRSGSMEPTYRPGDHVLVNKLAYRFGAPRRGDLVVFRRPRSDEVMLKRVVGVAGDRVAIRDGVLNVDGRNQREQYVDYSSVDSVYFGPVVVPRGAVFVMGDQRGNSLDSRTFGPVPDDRILGRVAVRIWPPRP